MHSTPEENASKANVSTPRTRAKKKRKAATHVTPTRRAPTYQIEAAKISNATVCIVDNFIGPVLIIDLLVENRAKVQTNHVMLVKLSESNCYPLLFGENGVIRTVGEWPKCSTLFSLKNLGSVRIKRQGRWVYAIGHARDEIWFEPDIKLLVDPK